MNIYGVVMGQGISVPSLVGNTLITGYGEDRADKVQTCSVVMLVNTEYGCAGLYHFPEGSINDDRDSIVVLRKMKDDVKPNEGYIAVGEMSWPETAGTFPVFNLNDVQIHNQQLRSFLLDLLPEKSRLRRMPATTGTVWITQEPGGVKVGFGALKGEVEDLRGQAAGFYREGYTLYGG
jgi:hypothetical protein